MQEETKLNQVVKLAQRLAREKDKRVVSESRGLKEYIRRKLDIAVRDLCTKNELVGGQILDYINYARKIVGRTLKEVYPYHLEMTEEEYVQLIDRIIQLVRDLHTRRFPLREDLREKVEKLAKRTLLSLDKLCREYERLKYGRED